MRPARPSALRASRRAVPAVTATALIALAALTGCTSKSEGKDGDGSVQVTAEDKACTVSTKEFPSGHVVLDIENKGSRVTEVYLLRPDARIVAERENIGPGTKQKLTAEVDAGAYQVVCKPGMKGEGYRQKVTATGGRTVARDPELDRAVADYRTYVQEQADATLPLAKKFAAAVEKGDLDAARKAYAPSRLGWERTEPVAESFGDIDPEVDVREDGLEEGQDPEKDWTGWHRLERSLFEDKKIGAREKSLATKLVKDLTDWQKRVGTAEITPTSMANGAKELLDEVATGKVTGEEERYSHTDLVDFKANVEGAEKAYQLLEPVAKRNDAALTARLDREFTAIDRLLDTYRKSPDSYEFTSYDKVGKADRKELSDAVNSLAEPLSKLAAAVVSK